MSIIVDNRFVFDICPEFLSSFFRFTESWKHADATVIEPVKSLYGQPSLAKIEHIFLSHLHFDHWGGLRHLLIWMHMFQLELRIQKPLHIYVPAESTKILINRAKLYFHSDIPSTANSGEDLERLLALEVGPGIHQIARFHEIKSGDKLQLGKYEIETRENQHIPGSLGFKIHFIKQKLNFKALEQYNVPKGPLLSELQRTGKIVFNGQTILVTDLFTIQRTSLGYSGDTAFNLEFFKWFNDVQLLLHETTYLDKDPSYHIEYHTSIIDLAPHLELLKQLQLMLPVHISQRYKWEEIETIIKQYQTQYPQWHWYAPKAGDLVVLKFAQEQPLIYSLPLIYRM